MLSGIRIDTDGGIATIDVENPTSELTMDAVREQIGCALIEAIYLPENVVLLTDKEGMYRARINTELTGMVRMHQPDWEAVCGVGFVLGVNPITGKAASLSLDQTASVIAWWRTATTGGNDPAALRPRLALVG